MIKRVSLVWKHPALSLSAFRDLWLGEHARLAQGLAGLRKYEIDFTTEGPPNAPAGLATLLFDTRSACDAAFADTALRDRLVRTRADFASETQVLFVDEHIVFSSLGETRK